MFCPLRSTAEKEVECSENCAWYVKSKINETTCEVNYLTEKLMEISGKIENLSNN